MAAHPAKALRAAIEAALRAGSPSIAAQIYNPEIETGAVLPYIQIAEIQVIGEDDPCIEASESFVTINVWGRGRDDVDDLVDQIRGLLYPDLTVTGHTVVVQEFQDERSSTDPDGSSRSVMTFRYQTTPSS